MYEVFYFNKTMLRDSREFYNEVVRENGGMQQILNITDLST
jgi:hypothetical protein